MKLNLPGPGVPRLATPSSCLAYSQLKPGGRLLFSSRGCSCLRQLQRQSIVCAADSQDGGFGKGFRNPFGGGSKKEEDARKQLQNLFKDRPDSLAMYDAPPGGGKDGGGKRNGGGGGGGGGGDWRSFDWREWGRRSWRSLQGSLKNIASALGAVLLFTGVLLLVSCGPATLSFLTGFLRRVLRLGGSARARPQLHQHRLKDDPKSRLGPYEQAMMAKYGSRPQSSQKTTATA